MNDENLVPFDKRTESEQREIAKKGGEASGKARQEKRAFRELLEIAFSKPDNKAEGDVSLKMSSVIKLVEKCAKGDLKAIELAADLLGEKIVKADVTQRSIGGNIDLGSLTDDQRKVLLSIGLDLVNRKE